MELKTYALYEDGIIHIENVYGGKNRKTILKGQIASEKEICNIMEVSVQEEVVYDIDHHIKSLPEDLRNIFESIRGKILELPSVEEVPLKIGITYRTTRSFVRFEFRKNWIMVLVRDVAYAEDTKKSVVDITSYGWGFNGQLKMTASDDPEYIFGIVKASYGSTL